MSSQRNTHHLIFLSCSLLALVLVSALLRGGVAASSEPRSRAMVPDSHGAWERLTLAGPLAGLDQVVAGDVDLDGTPDLVAGYAGETEKGSIFWYGFDPVTHVTTPHFVIDGSPGPLQLCDLDRDKDLDIIYADTSNNTLAWLECPADPTAQHWNWQLIATDIPDCTDLEPGRVDLDREFEVIAVSREDGEVLLFDPDENYSFWEETTISGSLEHARDCLLVDLDRDGDLDIVASGLDGTVAWYENREATWAEHEISTSLNVPRGLVAGDFNFDSWPDLLCGDSKGTIYIFQGKEDPANQSWSPTSVSDQFEELYQSQVGDLDEDGRLDPVLSTAGGLVWLRNTVEGFQGYEIDLGLPDSRGVTLGDMDQDGDLDVATAWGSQDHLLLFLSTSHDYQGGDVVFHPYPLQELQGPYAFDAADIDHDGLPDIAYSGDRPGIIQQRDDLQQPQVNILRDNGTAFSNLCLADMDMDGGTDLVMLGDEELYLFKNSGTNFAAWEAQVIQAGLTGDVQLELLDMNDDRFPDVLLRLENTSFWLEQNRSQPWESHEIAGFPGMADLFFSADINRDHLPDIVTMNDSKLVWLENTRDVSWPEHLISSDLAPTSLLPVDLKGNGTISLFYTQDAASFAGLLLNLGDGAAWDRVELAGLPEGLLAGSAGDLDEDGDTDILLHSPQNVSMVWASQEEGNLFSFHSIPVQEAMKETIILDMDLDGDPDILARDVNGSLSWYSNEMLLIELVDFQTGSFELLNPGGTLSLEGYSVSFGNNKLDLPLVNMPERGILQFRQGEEQPLDFQGFPSAIYYADLGGFPEPEYGELAMYFTSPEAAGPTILDFLVWSDNESWDQRSRGNAHQDAVSRGIWEPEEMIPIYGAEEILLRKSAGFDKNLASDFFVTALNVPPVTLSTVYLSINGVSTEEVNEGQEVKIHVTVTNDAGESFTGELVVYLESQEPEYELGRLTLELRPGEKQECVVSWIPVAGERTLHFAVEGIGGLYSQPLVVTQSFYVKEGDGNTEPEEGSSDDTLLPIPDVSPRTVVPTVSVIGVFGAVYISRREVSRYRWFALLVPLFTRLTKKDIEKDIEQQNFRGRIYQFIYNNPGAHYSQIKKDVGIGNGQLTHHLEMLQSLGFIKGRNSGKFKIFCVRGMNFPDKTERPVKLNMTQRSIVHLLFSTRELLSQKDIRNKIPEKVSQQAVSGNIKILEFYGIVRGVKKGTKRYVQIQSQVIIKGDNLVIPNGQGTQRVFFFS